MQAGKDMCGINGFRIEKMLQRKKHRLDVHLQNQRHPNVKNLL
jgi:hypothetical protein